MLVARRLLLLLTGWLAVNSVAIAQQPGQTPQKLPEVEVRAPRSPYQDAMEGASDGPFGPTIPWTGGYITRDSQRVGPYDQPAWTTERPFATTRVYVLPPGQAQVEQWVRPTWPRQGKAEIRFLEELAIGLPCRFQLDIYERWNVEPNAAGKETADHEGVQFEVRWALADWGKIPLNPTLYAEWIARDEGKPQTYELKLLLAEEIGCHCQYAANFVLEQDTSGEFETELAFSQALTRTIIDRKLMAGVEMVFQSNSVHGERSDPEISFKIGPSVQWRPTERTFLDIVPLFGTTGDSPTAQMYVIFGYQFGSRAAPREISGPASTRGQ